MTIVGQTKPRQHDPSAEIRRSAAVIISNAGGKVPAALARPRAERKVRVSRERQRRCFRCNREEQSANRKFGSVATFVKEPASAAAMGKAGEESEKRVDPAAVAEKESKDKIPESAIARRVYRYVHVR